MKYDLSFIFTFHLEIINEQVQDFRFLRKNQNNKNNNNNNNWKTIILWTKVWIV